MQSEALSVQRRTLGLEHPLTLMTAHNFARSLWRQEKRDQAMELLGDVIAVRVRTLGHSHPDTAEAARRLREMRAHGPVRKMHPEPRQKTPAGCARCGEALYCSRTCRRKRRISSLAAALE